MYDYPIQTSRPHRSYDGEGTVEQFDFQNTFSVWGDPNIQKNEVAFDVHEEADVRIGDIMIIPHELAWNE